MGDMKDILKGFMKKVSSSSSSSSSSSGFKGQGRVLGGTSSSSSEPPKNPYKNVEPKPNLPVGSASNAIRNPKSSISSSNLDKSLNSQKDLHQTSTDGFNKFDSLVTSSKRSQHGHSIEICECLVCGKPFRTTEEVTDHIDSCLGKKSVVDSAETTNLETNDENLESRNELASCVGGFLSGEPPEGSIEVVMRLLRNIVGNPENDKFRRIRMGNPKIKEAIVSVTGGVELLECVGVKLQEEGEKMCAVMEVTTGEHINSIKEVILMLEPKQIEDVAPTVPKLKDVVPAEPKKVDRHVDPSSAGAQYDREFIVCSLGLLSGIAEGLGSGVENLVAHSNLRDLLLQCCMDDTVDIRKSALALLGDLARVCPLHLHPRLSEFLSIASQQLSNSALQKTVAVANNVCWAIGELAVKVRQEVSPIAMIVMSCLVPWSEQILQGL